MSRRREKASSISSFVCNVCVLLDEKGLSRDRLILIDLSVVFYAGLSYSVHRAYKVLIVPYARLGHEEAYYSHYGCQGKERCLGGLLAIHVEEIVTEQSYPAEQEQDAHVAHYLLPLAVLVQHYCCCREACHADADVVENVYAAYCNVGVKQYGAHHKE